MEPKPTRYTHLVVSQRETEPPEVIPFYDEECAREFYDRASVRWTDTYLCEIIAGPGKPLKPPYQPIKEPDTK